MPPNASSAAVATVSAPSSVARSPTADAVSAPVARMLSATAEVRSAFRPVTTTEQPSAASTRAMAGPDARTAAGDEGTLARQLKIHVDVPFWSGVQVQGWVRGAGPRARPTCG